MVITIIVIIAVRFADDIFALTFDFGMFHSEIVGLPVCANMCKYVRVPEREKKRNR